MTRRSRQNFEVWLGLLAIVSAVVLFWGYFWLTGQPLGERGYHVMVVLPDAQGLSKGARVQVAGVEVGVVRSVQLAEPERVVIRLWVQRSVQLPRDSRALLQSVGVFGDQIVMLIPGSSTTLAANGDTLTAGVATGLTDLAAELGEDAEALLKQLERLLADSTIDQVHGTVAALPGTVRGVERMVRENSSEFAAMSRSLRQTAETLNNTLSGAEVDSTLADLRATAANMSETSDTLRDLADRLASVAEKIDNGEGTLGLMVNDPGLYQDLREATQSLASLTEDIRLNPGRYLKLAIF